MSLHVHCSYITLTQKFRYRYNSYILKYVLGQEKVDRYATIDKKKEMKGYIQK